MQSVMNWIVQAFNTMSSYFYELYLDCYYAYYIPIEVANWFYYLSTLSSDIAWYLSDLFSQMLTKFNEILNWDTIKSYIIGWLYWIPDLGSIFYYFWQNVTDTITQWWYTTQVTVKGWIDTAKAVLQSAIDALQIALNNLSVAWDAFKVKIPTIDTIISWFADWGSYVLQQIINWGALTSLQIQSLIATWFKDYEPFWEGWLDWKDAVIEFFTDPEDWLYKAMDRIIERFW